MEIDETNKNIRSGLDISVIGMAGMFPGARNVQEFWNNLKNGIESISFFKDKELSESGIASGEPENENYVKAKGMIHDIEYFDASFFDYSPVEAKVMDPQVRIFHECAWTALEDAGYVPERYKGLIGLYAGASNNIFWQSTALMSAAETASEFIETFQTSDKDHLSTRISYKLHLLGPSITLDTQCSTSLVAVHLACQALLSGECDIALAGGISILLPKKSGHYYQEGLLYSPDGHCRAFDARANGTVFGSGAGVVALKRIEDAIADHDHIYAVIKGSAINNDGHRKVGYEAPSIEGQAEVIQAAHQMAQIETQSISYIETHGTGTNIGDPIEIEGLKLAFSNVNGKGRCGIGSVKTNVGHLDNAAGIASLIKTVLALNHQFIPPTLHFATLNPKIDFDNSPFYVVSQAAEWKNSQYPLRAGVSSFGIGGTNAHVVLEEWPGAYRQEPTEHGAWSQGKGEVPSPSRDYQLIVLSAKTASARDTASRNLAEYLKNHPGMNLADMAYTLQVGRKAFPYRKVLVCSSSREAIHLLAAKGSEKIQSSVSEEVKRNIVLMFPGQGAQYVNMGRELYEKESPFREEMDRCFKILQPLMGYDIKEILYLTSRHYRSNSSYKSYINQTQITQPVIFALEYSLARLLMKWGIKPYAMIGHSIGEYVAACLAGVFSLEDALKLVVWRGKLMQNTPAGAMLSVPLAEKELLPLLDETLELAAVNAPSLCTVSGSHQAIERFSNQLAEKGYECRRLHTSHAFHSKLMDPIVEEFKDKVTGIELNKPQIPYLSNVTGQWITIEDAMDPAYWAAHLRAAVRFSHGLNQCLKEENSMFIEVGPGKTLSTLLRKHTNEVSDHPTVNLMRHPREKISDVECLLKGIGQLWLYGKDVNWAEFYQGEIRSRVPLPIYPFERKPYWLHGEPPKAFGTASKTGIKSFHGNQKTGMEKWFYTPSWKRFPLPVSPINKASLHSGVLIFIDKSNWGRGLVKEVQQFRQKCLIVKAGEAFTKESENEYIINPQHHDDYDTLFSDLQNSGNVPETIIHLWSVTTGNNKTSVMDRVDETETQDLGFYSLIYIAQAIGKQGITNQVKMLVVTNNMQEVTGEEVLQPTKATVLGPVRVIGREYPNIRCRSIDILLSRTGASQDKNLINQLLGEFTEESSDHIIAYRGNHRWVQCFEPIPPGQLGRVPTRLKKKGVYLITGGLGGIGLVLAEYLARSVQAKLILTGRSPFPPRGDWQKWLDNHEENDPVSAKIRKLREVEAVGGEVLVFNADAANWEQMQTVITRASGHFGQINGVIHSAGLADGGIIQQLTKDDLTRHLAAKLRGTLVLDGIFKGKQLDFFVLFSSMSSILGPIGQVGYCAANAFLDTFSHYKSSTGDGFTLAINWGAWKEVGMTQRLMKQWDENRNNPNWQLRLDDGILNSEGMDAFGAVLDGGFSQVLVTPKDLDMMMEQNLSLQGKTNLVDFLPDDISPEILDARPKISTDYVAPGDELQNKLVNIWQKYFGFETIGIYDDFFELGGDSLKGMKFVNAYKELLGEIVHVTIIYDAPNIAKLAIYFKEHYPQAVGKLLGIEITGAKTGVNVRIGSETITAVRRLIPSLPSWQDSDATRNKPVVLILAPPRSGSTLLRVILGGHPRLFSPPEMNLLSYNMFDKTFLDNQACIRTMMEIHQCGVEQAQNMMEDLVKQKLTVKAFYRLLQEWIAPGVMVDKTPQYAFDPEILKRAEEYFEHARYIHLLRHPYGMIRSFIEARMELFTGSRQKLKELSISPRELAESIWTLSHQNILKFLENIPGKRQYCVKFEDLVHQPGATVKGICHFLDLDFEPEMLEPYKEKKNRMTDGIYSEGLMVGDVKFHDHQRIDAEVADKWREYYHEDFLGDLTWQVARRFQYKPIKKPVYSAIESVEQKEYYDLSYNQKRIWLIYQTNPASPSYNMHKRIVLHHAVDQTKLKKVIHLVAQKHESLRTGFGSIGGRPVQWVLKEVEVPLKEIDLSYLDQEKKEQENEKTINREIMAPFNLAECPLFRVLLVKLEKEKYEFVFTVHHIISDALSMLILIKEFSRWYDNIRNNKKIALTPLKIHYKDFSQWQNKQFRNPAIKEKSHQFWQTKLSAGFPPLKLPVDFDGDKNDASGAAYTNTINLELKEALKKFARENNTSLFTVMFAAFNLILSHLSEQKDVVCAVASAGREHIGLDDVVGFFINTVLIKSNVEPNEDFVDFLHRVNQNIKDVLQHQSYPLEQVLDDMKMNFPDMKVFFNMHNMKAAEKKEDLNSSKPYHRDNVQDIKFDITLYVFEYSNGIELHMHYRKSLFRPITIESIVIAYIDLLKEIY